MNYELYIDVFFGVNFMMDFLVLFLVRKCLRYQASLIRLTGAAAFGAACMCLLVCLPIKALWLVQLVFYVVSYTGMCVAAFGWEGIGKLAKGTVAIYAGSVLTGGIFQWCAWKVSHLGVLLIFAGITGAGISIFVTLFKRLSDGRKLICPVVLVLGKKKMSLKGLWDTGNMLASPYSRKGISVIGFEEIKKILEKGQLAVLSCILDKEETKAIAAEDNERMHLFFVPYTSVGRQSGYLPVIQADKMFIRRNEETICYIKPLLGISQNAIHPEGEYQIILTTAG